MRDPGEQIWDEIRVEFPAARLVKKADAWTMRLAGALLFAVTLGQNRDFQRRYVTTLGTTVYVPSDWDAFSPWTRASLLRHERVHMRQRRRLGSVLFTLIYLVPFLPLFLAYGRARLELEAYTESMRADRAYGRDIFDPAYRAFLIRQFTTGAYGWMWPFRATVDRWLEDAARAVAAERDDGRGGAP